MVFLLPPRVVGPVSVLSTHVDVAGAYVGASVRLYVNGAAIPPNPAVPAATASEYGTISLVLAGTTLTAGDLLTAVQTLDPDTSGESRILEPVLGFPSSLSPLVFLSEVHRCVDAILLGGTYVNSAITVTLDGNVIGSERGNGGTVSVSLSGGPFPEKHVLIATQTVAWSGQTATSPPTQSLPIQPSPVREQPPSVYIVPPLFECDPSVTVSGILDGATVVLESNLGGHSEYPFQGNTAHLFTGALHIPEVMTATQVFRTCGTVGRPSAPTPVTKPVSFPAPSLPATLCRDAPSITIWNLMPGAVVSIYIGVTDGVQTSESLIGQASVASATQTFDLPSSIGANPLGPWQFLKCFQERCGIGGPTSNEAHFLDGPTNPTPPFIGRLVECAATVRVQDLTPGTNLRLISDQPDTPVLSLPYPVVGGTMDVPLYRALRAGEMVTAVLTGCGAGPDARLTRRVDSLGSLDPPRLFTPIRAWMSEVVALDCVIGAQVHVFVNNVWRNQATAYEEQVRIWVGTLGVEDQVTVQQCMCTAISHPSPLSPVVPGAMHLTQSPAPIVRGPNPAAVTIFAVDEDDRHAVAGLIHFPGGLAVPTNSQFSWVFPVGQPGPPTSVTADGYATVTMTWDLKDQVPSPPPPTTPPPPSPTLTVDLQSIASNPPVVAIKAVQWEILKSTSASTTPAVIAAPAGPTASLPLPKPTAPATFDWYFVGCTVTLATIYGDKTISGVDAPFSNLPYHAMLEWTGGSATAHFLLVGTPVKDDYGNLIDYVVEIKFIGL
jgi:hypothetical protein